MPSIISTNKSKKNFRVTLILDAIDYERILKLAYTEGMTAPKWAGKFIKESMPSDEEISRRVKATVTGR